jgi:hypothetical protein
MNNSKHEGVKGGKRPLALTVLVLCVFGVSLWTIISRVLADRGLDLGRIMFPMLNIVAAFGLLNYRAGWRKYLLVIAAYWGVLVLLFAPWAMLNPERIVIRFPAVMVEDRPHLLESWFTIACALVANAAALGWVFWVLLRRDVRMLFYRAEANRIRTN